jgi:hypothetical protein
MAGAVQRKQERGTVEFQPARFALLPAAGRAKRDPA